jgi:arylsulfatase A-like enzyme/Flp pilus assembly protein TadD
MPAPPPARRVVLVSIDTLRADHVGAWGAAGAETPTLDALAARGARFAEAVSPTPITLPSHASLLTAREPYAHGVHHNGVYRLGDEHPTLPERMREAGFATAGFVSAHVLDRAYGLARGFDSYDDQLAARAPGRGLISVAERSADRTVAAVESWLAEAPDRFFVFVHFYDPHSEYAPPPPFDARFRARPYDGEIAFVDAQLGRLLAAIDARFPDGATLVAVTSDHGESLGEHGEPTHSYGIYDATQHVPLLLAGPGVPAGRVVDAQVRLVDVAPTLLALAGAPALAGEGRSLEPLLAGAEDAPRVAYLETLATRLEQDWSPLFGVRGGGFKYVRAPRPELYALADDPRETQDLSQRDPERLASLSAELDALLAGAGPAAAPAPVDALARAQLEQLGYVIGAPAEQALPLGQVGGIDPKDAISTVAAVHDANGLLASDRPLEAKARIESIPPRGFNVLQMRALVALALGDLPAARAAADAALAAAPQRPDAYDLRASVCLQAGDADCATAALRRSLELAPGSGGPLATLGVIAEQRGDLGEAERLYREALGARAPAPAASWRLAALLLARGDRTEAFALLEATPSGLLADPLAALRLAEAENGAGHPDLALLRVEAALRRRPRNVALLRIAGALREVQGNLPGASQAREAALALAPEDVGLRNELAWSLAREGRDLDRALTLARGAVADGGRAPQLLDTLATVLVRRGEGGEALPLIEEARPGADDALRSHLDELEQEARKQASEG